MKGFLAALQTRAAPHHSLISVQLAHDVLSGNDRDQTGLVNAGQLENAENEEVAHAEPVRRAHIIS
jgi:hypothetical protein